MNDLPKWWEPVAVGLAIVAVCAVVLTVKHANMLPGVFDAKTEASGRR